MKTTSALLAAFALSRPAPAGAQARQYAAFLGGRVNHFLDDGGRPAWNDGGGQPGMMGGGDPGMGWVSGHDGPTSGNGMG